MWPAFYWSRLRFGQSIVSWQKMISFCSATVRICSGIFHLADVHISVWGKIWSLQDSIHHHNEISEHSWHQWQHSQYPCFHSQPGICFNYSIIYFVPYHYNHLSNKICSCPHADAPTVSWVWSTTHFVFPVPPLLTGDIPETWPIPLHLLTRILVSDQLGTNSVSTVMNTFVVSISWAWKQDNLLSCYFKLR